MRSETDKTVVVAERPTTAQPIYIMECDSMELARFYDERDTLIPKHNRHAIDEIFNGGYGHTESWYGGLKSWEEARKVLTDGWPKGAEQAQKLAEELGAALPDPQSIRRRTAWKDDGGELDRDRLYSQGLETAFRSTTQHRTTAPRVLRIVANWSMHEGYTAEQISWNGAAMCALLDLLENASYRCELSLCFATRQYAMRPVSVSMPVIRVKEAREPLNISRIAAVASHAGVYRSFGFAALCSTPYPVNSGLGSCLNARDAYRIAVEQKISEAVDLHIEISSTKGEAIRTCTKVLADLFPTDTALMAACAAANDKAGY